MIRHLGRRDGGPTRLSGKPRLCYMYGPILMRMLLVPLSRFLLAGLLLASGGCAWLRPAPTPILPPDELYSQGESELERRRYIEAREAFRKIVERHPNSAWAPRARFLVGEAFYREAEFDKAVKEFETFLAFYPRHQIADLVQYRLAMSYYDQLKPVEQDQGLTAKAIEQLRKLVKEYPDSRYATDALAKIDICRGRLAQKEVWVATYYFTQGNPSAARQRLEFVLKEYPRTLVIPETLFTLAEVNFAEGKKREGTELLRQLAADYGFTEWGKRAVQRLREQR
jgi:outer membrane protein assembly factor BamD